MERAATASKLLYHIPDLVRANCLRGVVLYCRVSARSRRSNLLDQEDCLGSFMKAWGIPVLGSTSEALSGYSTIERPQLLAAIEIARAFGDGVAVVAESTDRFLRNVEYRDDRTLSPTRADFQKLSKLAGDVWLGTLLDPDATHEEVRVHQQDRGKTCKQKTGGRPKKVRYGSNYRAGLAFDKLTWLLGVGCISRRNIARMLNRSESTVRGWISMWEMESGKRWPGERES